ncbi:MAG TPA: serine/threonine-protein kinase, partial [Ignavibacteriaceae bacterium]|nr:serine/threonine-protein kinase [Ignavibacteriaceae bacterium]
MINDRYILKNKLGEGRSKVYLCTDTDLNQKEFAVKILPNDRDSNEKKLFKYEFFSLKKLDHPAIVKPYDLGTVTKTDEQSENEFFGSRYFTLEYFPGTELLHFPGIKNPDVLREIFIQICSVLYYLHQSNYIYYDLKPENILAAQLNGIPAVKLIDLGLASHLSSGPLKTIRGTAEYIAPEILRKEAHDHRADLYSLGILLYRIIYNRFPFTADNKVEVYRAQIEKEFEFPALDYPGYFSVIMKKLLNKDPEKRYANSLQVIKDLNSGNENLSRTFVPAKIFTARKDIINILSTFIDDNESTELFVIKGAEDSGKSALLNQLYSLNEKTIPVFNISGKTGFDFIKMFIKDIVFSEHVYPNLSGELREKINNFIHGSGAGIIDELNSIISQISLSSKFVLLIDDFNKLDQFSWELFREIIPILQVNYIKVIAAEDSDYESFSKLLHNTKELMLNPLTEIQVNEFVEKSFAGFFPREQLGKIILIYSDLLPGNIIRFIHDLVFLKIIKYENGTPEIREDETPLIETILKSSQQEIYNIRMNSLAKIETEAAKYISAFEAPIEPYFLSALLDIEQKEILQILGKLLNKNIIHLNQQSGIPVITSDGFKKYIYSTIHEKKELHSRIAVLLEKIGSIDRNETARHYELAGNYLKCFSLLSEEAGNARNMSAFSYQKKIYHHLLKLPLDEKNHAGVKYNLADIHFKL